jgi:hypothetical protein
MLVTVTEIPPECGLLVVEAGFATFAQWKDFIAPTPAFQLRSRHQGVLHNHRACTMARYSRPNLVACCGYDG